MTSLWSWNLRLKAWNGNIFQSVPAAETWLITSVPTTVLLIFNTTGGPFLQIFTWGWSTFGFKSGLSCTGTLFHGPGDKNFSGYDLEFCVPSALCIKTVVVGTALNSWGSCPILTKLSLKVILKCDWGKWIVSCASMMAIQSPSLMVIPWDGIPSAQVALMTPAASSNESTSTRVTDSFGVMIRIGLAISNRTTCQAQSR